MTRKREEDDTLGQMRQVFEAMGFLTYHTYDSRRCPPGFPDLWVIGFGKLLVLELKAGRNTTTTEQDRWLAELRAAGIDARVYHVSQWPSRNIVKELQAVKDTWRKQHRGERHVRTQHVQPWKPESANVRAPARPAHASKS